jgi:phosphoglycolate phosphatase
MKPILLFDIDGTLLQVKKEFLRDGLTEILDRHGISSSIMNGMRFAGRTDRDIFTELSLKSDRGESAGLYNSIRRSYLNFMLAELDSSVVNVFSGVRETIEGICRIGYRTGLCTGNFREIAIKKIEAAGLGDTFNFGGYGCNHHDRIHLPAEAHQSYVSHYGTVPKPEEYVVIGDTPNDIRCARYFGARCIAVATGGYSEDQLAADKPDMVMPGLDSLEDWLREI